MNICRKTQIELKVRTPLFDIYQNVESAKELWDSLESKYMAEDASSKKFLTHQRGVTVSLGGGISSGGKKSRESNIGDSDNTKDGGTIVGGRIVTYGGLMASFACMTFI
ncbi:hypothetical protein Tco_0673381 [Tanacetum coccineum]